MALNAELQGWLQHRALPLWDEYGVDRRAGGYFEHLLPASDTGDIESGGASRRGRVVARQLFVFDLGQRRGWRSAHSDPVAHGCEYLFSTMRREDGLFHTAVSALGGHPQGNFSLYEQAFYLFALARLKTHWGMRFPVEEAALHCLDRLRDGWGKAQGGFEESNPPTLPLQSNPHMHLLEAALEWRRAAAASARAPWVALARELVELCLTRFVDSHSGVLREYFTADWQTAPGEAGRIVEPGHQFEWGWLLLQWANAADCEPPQRDACRAAAVRLIEVGEESGVDPVRGVAINELWDDLTVKDAAAKLWPQTERLKAWCALRELAADPAAAARAEAKITAAIQGLAGYFRVHPAGLWHEAQWPDGTFSAEPCKASSFYHIVFALDMLQRTATIIRQSP